MAALVPLTCCPTARSADAGTRPATTTDDPAAVFIRPSGFGNEAPVWGVRGGIEVALWPTGGPRGLIRIYTPYLHQPDRRVFNFIAVEPTVNNTRGLSELEFSHGDQRRGKPMWTADTLDLQHPLACSTTPACGVVTRDGDAAVLHFFLYVERFDNGADPVVGITLRSDRPREVSLQTFAAADSATMSSCVLTATMGNWSRLRHVHLKDQTVGAADVFAQEQPNDVGFYPWHQWPASVMTQSNGRYTVWATGDLDQQPEPAEVPTDWRYVGLPAVQTWSTAVRPGVIARVNGRKVFWASRAAVPGGVAFENFEMDAPFQAGAEFRYSVSETPVP